MKNEHAMALGKLGGKAGRGPAKARTSEQMRAAANRRWAMYRARVATIKSDFEQHMKTTETLNKLLTT